MERWIRPAFVVIGLEGSTEMGEGFVQRLWTEANRRFPEVAPLARRNPDGSPEGIWGAMTDMARQFLPWEDGFTRGLYLAGVSCREDAAAPAGWTRWEVPGFEYLRIRSDSPDAFGRGLAEMARLGLPLAGAVQDYTDPASGVSYMCFPVRRLE